MNTSSASLWVGAALLLAAGPTVAQQPAAPADPLADLRACQAVPDAQVRLACYDAAMNRLNAARPAAPAAPIAARPTATPTPAPTPAAAVAAPAPADTGFGLPEPRRPVAVEGIESRLAGRFEGWAPGTRLELANGQVWEVVDGTRASYELDRPAVRVRRGVLGSYFIEIDGVSATPRVRRVR